MLLVEAAVVEQQAVGLSGSKPLDKGEQVLQSEGNEMRNLSSLKKTKIQALHEIQQHYINTLSRGHTALLIYSVACKPLERARHFSLSAASLWPAFQNLQSKHVHTHHARGEQVGDSRTEPSLHSEWLCHGDRASNNEGSAKRAFTFPIASSLACVLRHLGDDVGRGPCVCI